MLRVGFIGWRGMVGSVLLERIRQEKNFALLDPVFFSTSNVGGAAPKEAGNGAVLSDAKNPRDLASCDVLVSCQGGEYTTQVYAPLRQSGWKGYWIDAASTLRMSDEAVASSSTPSMRKYIKQGLSCRRRSRFRRRQLHR